MESVKRIPYAYERASPKSCMKAGTRFSSARHLSDSSRSYTNCDESDYRNASSRTSISPSSSASCRAHGIAVSPRGSSLIALSELDELCLLLIKTREVKQAIRSLSWQPPPPGHTSDQINFAYPDLFDSLCICDPKITGYPIQLQTANFTLGSRGMQVGACKFLNLPHGEHDTCNIYSEPDSFGSVKFVLEYTGNLVRYKNCATDYILISKMDITAAVHVLASSAVAAGFCSSTVPMNFKASSISINWLQAAEELDAEALLTNLGFPDNRFPLSPALLHEFNEVVKDIHFFHRDCFTLCSDPVTGFWRIQWMSPSVATSEADLKAAMTGTTKGKLNSLGERLSGRKPVSLLVKWGVEREERRVYCIPMCRAGVTCWMCFLLRGSIPNLWTL